MDVTLIGISTSDQRGPGSNASEKVYRIAKSSRTGKEEDFGFMVHHPQQVIQCQAQFVHVYNMYDLKTNSS